MTTKDKKKLAGTITPEQAPALANEAAPARRGGPTRIVILGGEFAGVYTAKFKLPGFARRLRVALDWTLDLFFAKLLRGRHPEAVASAQATEVGQPQLPSAPS